MILKRDKLRLKQMLSDSVTLLCRAGLPFESKFQVEALIGITLDDNEVVLVSFKETMANNGLLVSDTEHNNNDEDEEEIKDDENSNSENTNLPLTDMAKCLKWELPSHDCATNGDDLPFDDDDYRDPQQFVEACSDQNYANLSKIQTQKQKKRRIRERKLQTAAAIKYEPSDNDGIEYDQDFADSKSFQEQFDLRPLSPNDDDCMIVKSEDSGKNDCYGPDEQQFNAYQQQDDYSNYQDVQPSEDVNGSAYSQNATWTPSFSKTSAKPKLPSHQSRPHWASKSTHSSVKTKCAQPSVKLSKRSPSTNTEGAPDDSIIGRAVMQCAYCDAVFNRSHVLKEHVNGVHFKKKMFHCPDCGESFKWRAELSRHRRVPGLCPCGGTAGSEWPSQG